MPYATNGPSVAQVKVHHWWPGRKWAGECPFPADYLKTLKRNPYATVAFVDLAGVKVIGTARCHSTLDVPLRTRGRNIAMDRLAKNLAEAGWRYMTAEEEVEYRDTLRKAKEQDDEGETS